ncbi:MAG: DoxX family protein [Candidatus Micrarchaeota archaeon]|nr:DoxX family protein [Candidatus Micrarchaeota archaeon]
MKKVEYTKEDWGLLALRLIFVAFMLHGIQKFTSLDGTAQFFEKIGIPAPYIMAPIVAFVETFGSLAIILGIGTSIAAPLLAFVMFVAILTAHLGSMLAKGFPFGLLGGELPLANMLASIAIMLLGPGKISLEEQLKKK